MSRACFPTVYGFETRMPKVGSAIELDVVVHASLPFTVLKPQPGQCRRALPLKWSRACFPTVYGFETRMPKVGSAIELDVVVHASLPFTVLKPQPGQCRRALPLKWSRACFPTVYGFETSKYFGYIAMNNLLVVHASLPFTVLKLLSLLQMLASLLLQRRACFPTVYGFETLFWYAEYEFTSLYIVVHASLPFTVLKLL